MDSSWLLLIAPAAAQQVNQPLSNIQKVNEESLSRRAPFSPRREEKSKHKKSCRPYFSLLNKAASRQWPKQNWPPAIKKWALLISIKVESFKIKALPRFFFLFKGEKDFFFKHTLELINC